MGTAAQFQPSGNAVKQAAFSQHRRSGKLTKSRGVVLHALATLGFATRQTIATTAELPVSSVCGRCRELLDLGYIEVSGLSVDSPARQMLRVTDAGRVLLAQAAAEQFAKQEAAHAE